MGMLTIQFHDEQINLTYLLHKHIFLRMNIDFPNIHIKFVTIFAAIISASEDLI